MLAADVDTHHWRECLQRCHTCICRQLSRQPVHLRRGERNVPGRRATVLSPDTDQTLCLLHLSVRECVNVTVLSRLYYGCIDLVLLAFALIMYIKKKYIE